MYTKKNARVTFKSHRRSNYKRSNNFSNGRTRSRGNVTQQYNKYLKLAKEAFTSGDRIQSEYYYQFTDHYYRLMVELGINIEDNEANTENKNNNEEGNEVIKENKNNDNDEDNEKDKIEDDKLESIESIPFIAEPAKKKRAKTTK